MLYVMAVTTPLGLLWARHDGRQLWALTWEEPAAGELEQWWPKVFDMVTAYFASGTMPKVVPLAALGTPFQRQVWGAAQTIEFGTVVSYGELARRMGKPGAVRAVGQALAQNPWMLIVPCHRVVGHDGRLRGYRGGAHRQQWLLRFERENAASH